MIKYKPFYLFKDNIRKHGNERLCHAEDYIVRQSKVINLINMFVDDKEEEVKNVTLGIRKK